MYQNIFVRPVLIGCINHVLTEPLVLKFLDRTCWNNSTINQENAVIVLAFIVAMRPGYNNPDYPLSQFPLDSRKSKYYHPLDFARNK